MLSKRSWRIILLLCISGLSACVIWKAIIFPIFLETEGISLSSVLRGDSFLSENSTEYNWTQITESHLAYLLSLDIFIATLLFGAALSYTENNIKYIVHSLVGSIIGAAVGYMATPGIYSSIHPLILMSIMPFCIIGFSLAITFFDLSPKDETVIRGTKVTQFDERNHSSSAKGLTSLGPLSLSEWVETRHFVAIGVTGSGKSTFLKSLLKSSVERNDCHVVADSNGELMSKFFRDGDVILNPFDKRSMKWDILSEIKQNSDYRFLAEIVLPRLSDPASEQWVKWGREIFAACLRNWHQNPAAGGSDEFFNEMVLADEEVLAALCSGTGAIRFFHKENTKMLANILATMVPELERLREFNSFGGTPFSIRNWIRKGQGSLWFTYRSDQIASLRELISSWMGLAISETLALQESKQRRIWFYLDELGALGKINALYDALTRIRKQGGRVVIGVQSIAQISAIYGKDTASAIIENCDNKIILRCNPSEGGGTAKFASDLIGDREIYSKDRSISMQRGKGELSHSISERKTIERAVLPSELTQLEDLTAFVKLADRTDWLSLKVKPTNLKKKTPIFIGHESMSLKK